MSPLMNGTRFARPLRLILSIGLVLTFMVIGVKADAPKENRSTRAEIRFLEGMIDHHQMALDMAQDCLAKDVSDEMKTLCQGVIDAQTPEIEKMQGWLMDWYNIEYTPVPMASMPEASMGGMTMGAAKTPATDPAGMMGMFAEFNRLNGVDYEIAWLESMIDHHDDAIHMSERLLPRVNHADLRGLAEAIIKDQTAEIKKMETMLTVLDPVK